MKALKQLGKAAAGMVSTLAIALSIIGAIASGDVVFIVAGIIAVPAAGYIFYKHWSAWNEWLNK